MSLSRWEGELEEPCDDEDYDDDDDDDAMLLAVRSVCAPCGQARTRASRVSRELCDECSGDCILIGSYLVVTSPILLCIFFQHFFFVSLSHHFLGVCLFVVLCCPMKVVAVTPVAGGKGFKLVAWDKMFATVNLLYQSCTCRKTEKDSVGLISCNHCWSSTPLCFSFLTV